MNYKSQKSYKKISFKKAKIVEIADEINNPYRGWYQIHTFDISKKISMADREYTLNATDTLAFVLLDINEYRNKPLDKVAIENIDTIFDFFKGFNIDMIVRAVYDNVGNCLETEPQTEDIIIGHMKQLVPLIKKYSANIFVYQGLLIGNWGEMHSSKFLSPTRLKKLASKFMDALSGSAFLAVRRPAYIRILFPEGEDTRQTRVGIFDDAILASPTHLGTFGELPAKEVKREQSWLPEEELEYVSALCDRVPYGGEALHTEIPDALTEVRGSLRKTVAYFERLHVTYLNRIHDVVFIDQLKDMVWRKPGVFRNMNGYDYVGRHLGYRLVLRNVKMSQVNGSDDLLRWDIEIENVGFARVFFKNSCIMHGLDEFEKPVEIDVSEWLELSLVKSGENHNFVCMTPIIHGDIWLDFKKADNKQSVYFANKRLSDVGDKSSLYLGNVKIK